MAYLFLFVPPRFLAVYCQSMCGFCVSVPDHQGFFFKGWRCLCSSSPSGTFCVFASCYSFSNFSVSRRLGASHLARLQCCLRGHEPHTSEIGPDALVHHLSINICKAKRDHHDEGYRYGVSAEELSKTSLSSAPAISLLNLHPVKQLWRLACRLPPFKGQSQHSCLQSISGEKF